MNFFNCAPYNDESALTDTALRGVYSQMKNTACQCSLARLVTLEVDRSLWNNLHYY